MSESETRIQALRVAVDRDPTKFAGNNCVLALKFLAGVDFADGDTAKKTLLQVMSTQATIKPTRLNKLFKQAREQRPELITQLRLAIKDHDTAALNKLFVGPVYDLLLQFGLDITVFMG